MGCNHDVIKLVDGVYPTKVQSKNSAKSCRNHAVIKDGGGGMPAELVNTS